MNSEENKKLMEEAAGERGSLTKILGSDVVPTSTFNGQNMVSDRTEIETETIDLVQSAQGKKILTGILSGVDDRLSPGEEPDVRPMPVAEIAYGHYRIVIPASEIVYEHDGFDGKNHNEQCRYYHRQLRRMLGAIVDFKIDDEKFIFKDKLFAVGSSKSAMLRKRIECFKGFGKKAPLLKKGDITEARVLRTTRFNGLIVEVGGTETLVPYADAYWSPDDVGRYRVGDMVAVKLNNIFVNGNDVDVECSIKEANPNPYALARMKYKRNQVYAASVESITAYGIFCKLKADGYTCLCRYKDVKRPNVGDNVQVLILGFNDRTEHIKGEILNNNVIVK